MNELKNELQDTLNKLNGLVERARHLKNQNLADVAASAHGKVKQLSDHPDLELVEDRKDQAHPGNPVYAAPATRDEAIERMRLDGDADPESTARTNWPQLFEPTGGNIRSERTFKPGDSQFDQSNRDFRRPDDVDLNRDGTLQRAPNSLGTAPDLRK